MKTKREQLIEALKKTAAQKIYSHRAYAERAANIAHIVTQIKSLDD